MRKTNFDYIPLPKFMGLPVFQKKHHLGPQNNFESSGPEKLSKIVNYATIKEIEKLKETIVGVQVE